MDINSLMNTVKQSELYGNNQNYGKKFEDINLCSEKGLPLPKSIIVRKGAIVDNLTFVYDTFTAAHGGQGGSKQEMPLQKDEYIVKVAGTYARFSNESLIETLSFTTNKGKVFAAGNPRPGNNYFEYQAESGYAICGVFGRADRYLANIGFYSKKTDANTGSGFSDNKVSDMFNNFRK